jgi:hypothetical protein
MESAAAVRTASNRAQTGFEIRTLIAKAYRIGAVDARGSQEMKKGGAEFRPRPQLHHAALLPASARDI